MLFKVVAGWGGIAPVTHVSPSAVNHWGRLLGASYNLWLRVSQNSLEGSSQSSLPPPQHGMWPEVPTEPGKRSYRRVHPTWNNHFGDASTPVPAVVCSQQRRQRRGWHLLQVYATVSVTMLLSGGATRTLCPSLCGNSPWQELLFKWRRKKSEWECKCFRDGCFFIPAPKFF